MADRYEDLIMHRRPTVIGWDLAQAQDRCYKDLFRRITHPPYIAPQPVKEDPTMHHDLTIMPAPKGGYVITDDNGDTAFAGNLTDCLAHIQAHFIQVTLQAQQDAEKVEADRVERERLRAVEAEVARIRREGL